MSDPFGVPSSAPSRTNPRSGGSGGNPPPAGIPTLGERVVQSWRDWLQRALTPSTVARGSRLDAPTRRPPVEAYGAASPAGSDPLGGSGGEWATPTTSFSSSSSTGAGVGGVAPMGGPATMVVEDEDDCYCDFDENVST